MKSLFNKKKLPFKCIHKNCSDKNFQKIPNFFDENFYVKAMLEDLNITKSEMSNNMPSYSCNKCKLIFHKSWFNENTAYSVFNSVYGQHHYGWKNFYKFISTGELVDHGNLYTFINKLKIKTYGEFNCPFSGIFFNFLNKEINFKNYYDLIIKKNNSRQVANKKKIEKLDIKKQKIITHNKQLFLIKDNSPYCWGDNCNSNSINCKSLSQQIMNLNILNFESFKKLDIKFDLFGIFMTLDHTQNFYEILDIILNKTKLIIIHCHINYNITKQHAFVITNDFFDLYSKTKKINIKNITPLIREEVSSRESYYLLSKNKIRF